MEDESQSLLRMFQANMAAWLEQEKRGESPFGAFSTRAVIVSGGFESILRGEDPKALDRIEEQGPPGSKGTIYAAIATGDPNVPPPVREWSRDRIMGVLGKHPDLRVCPQCGVLFDTKKAKRWRFCSEDCYKRASRPDDRSDRRKAYRRVYIQFGRMIDKRKDPLSPERAINTLKTTEPYKSLIEKWDLKIDSWIEEKGDGNGTERR